MRDDDFLSQEMGEIVVEFHLYMLLSPLPLPTTHFINPSTHSLPYPVSNTISPLYNPTFIFIPREMHGEERKKNGKWKLEKEKRKKEWRVE